MWARASRSCGSGKAAYLLNITGSSQGQSQNQIQIQSQKRRTRAPAPHNHPFLDTLFYALYP
jgi:hypothetical protein